MIYKALLLFFVFEYLRPGNIIPGLDLLRLNLLVPVTAILGTLALRTPVSSQQFFEETNTKLMGVLLSLLIVSTVFATVTMEAYEVTKNVFAYMLIYMVLVRQLGDVDRIKGVFRMLVAVHMAAIVLSPEMFTESGRASVMVGGFLGDGNDFSLSVNICLPLCLYLLLESKKVLRKVFWACAVLILVMAIVATQSRGGTLALIVVGTYFWAKSPRKLLTASLAVCAVVVVFAAAPPEYFERMETMTDTEEGSAQGRINAWKTAIGMAARNPLLGAGAGHFGMAYGHANGGRWMTAHSIYFLLLGELGLPGLIVLLTLIYSNLAANQRLQREVRRMGGDRAQSVANLLSCTSASLVAFAVAGAFLSATYYPHMYVISGLLAATRHVVRQELAAQVEVGRVPEPALGAAAAPVLVRNGVISPEWRPRLLGPQDSTGNPA